MKGYLSRIAEQSGLRYLEKSAQSRGVSGGHRVHDAAPLEHDAAPLEHEDSTLVPPSNVAENLEPAIEKDATRLLRREPSQESVHSAGEKPGLSVSREVPVQSASRYGVDGVSDETRIVPGSTEDSARSLSLSAGIQDAHSGVSGARAAVEQSVREDSGHADEARARGRRSDAVDSNGARSAKSVDVPFEPGSGHRESFARTAGIIEKGDVGTEDAQSVLLQEVHEWVASSSAGASAEQEESTRASEAVQPKRRPVVTSRENVQREEVEPARPVEQSFELSIGTISVIVEQLEQARLPEPPARQPSNAAAKGPEPRFSRLGRSYL